MAPQNARTRKLVIRIAVATLIAGALFLFTVNPWPARAREFEQPWSAPEFTQTSPADWLNSEPLTLRDLHGKVVLIDFWTFGCWNCTQSIPWLKQVEKEFSGTDLVVLGIHTPEFDHEKDRARVLEKTKEYGLTHPVMLDNNFAYWKAMGNKFWPAFYVIDKVGRVRALFIGETHSGDRSAMAIEQLLRRLLAETV